MVFMSYNTTIIGYKTPCVFNDVWKGIELNGFVTDVYNEFILYPLKKNLQFGTTTKD